MTARKLSRADERRLLRDPRPSPVVAAELGVSESRVRQIRSAVNPGGWGTGGGHVGVHAGDRNPSAKLTWGAVAWLRRQSARFARDHGTLRDQLEERFGISVTRAAVSDAIAGRTWGTPS